MFENGMDINIKCILWKKCLGFDQMHFGIITRMFSVYKHWAEINSAIPCRGEIWSLFCPQGLGGTSLCVSYFCEKPQRTLRIRLFPLKLRFLWLCISAPVHADTRAHIHTPTSAVGSLFGTRACSPGASPGWSGTQAACGSHYESGSYKRTDWRDTVAPQEERRPRSQERGLALFLTLPVTLGQSPHSPKAGGVCLPAWNTALP